MQVRQFRQQNTVILAKAPHLTHDLHIGQTIEL